MLVEARSCQEKQETSQIKDQESKEMLLIFFFFAFFKEGLEVLIMP